MDEVRNTLRLDQGATYKIVVQGWFDESWKEWFGVMSVLVREDNGRGVVTTLTGHVRDQAELHGLLTRTRDLCLPLLEVRLLQSDPLPTDGSGQQTD
jgi:predicted GNAT superfamily acetyltransferase